MPRTARPRRFAFSRSKHPACRAELLTAAISCKKEAFLRSEYMDEEHMP